MDGPTETTFLSRLEVHTPEPQKHNWLLFNSTMTEYNSLPPSAKQYFHDKELHAKSLVNKLMQRLNNDDYRTVPSYTAQEMMQNTASDVVQGSHRLNQAEAETTYKNWREVAAQEFETWKENACFLFREGDNRHPAQDWRKKADQAYDDWMRGIAKLANEQFHDYNLEWDPVKGWIDVAEVKHPESHLIDPLDDHRTFQDEMHDAVANSADTSQSVDEVLRHKLDLVYGGFHPGRMVQTDNSDGHVVTNNVEEKRRITKPHIDRVHTTRETNHVNEQQYELKKTDIRAKPPIEKGQIRDRVREMEVYSERFEM
mmetsp:Transcript_1906/g.6817  ORF Transcript_1906/g.6817 Transcript_1906/m.6817 type:complete len:313 (-) Transcript_1906:1874-2812(-)